MVLKTSPTQGGKHPGPIRTLSKLRRRRRHRNTFGVTCGSSFRTAMLWRNWFCMVLCSLL